MMSERELNRVEVLAQVDDGRLTVDNAANLLDLAERARSKIFCIERSKWLRLHDGKTVIGHPVTFQLGCNFTRSSWVGGNKLLRNN
ncbi:hypothetical protein AB838_04740 [Rhodobacteraceae bacterium (ex Bugula neritina AB1)]|nr:hypothetical protein AB838_04740 [Rhodobacteraceae bacterium (ex Bugula neritina AB1)]